MSVFLSEKLSWIIYLLRIGRIHFTFGSQPSSLTLFWIQVYGGGLFPLFRDQTNNHETYGGSRYLLDTIKLADLGREEGKYAVEKHGYTLWIEIPWPPNPP